LVFALITWSHHLVNLKEFFTILNHLHYNLVIILINLIIFVFIVTAIFTDIMYLLNYVNANIIFLIFQTKTTTKKIIKIKINALLLI
jgi:hypothetical protein